MFEKASRMKLRFKSGKGFLSVEDLWDLPLVGPGVHLDGIAKGLYKELQDDGVQSFVTKSTKNNTVNQLRFNLVKHIIDVRLAEKEVAEMAKLKREKKQKILAIIAEKEDEVLKGASSDELKKQLEKL